MDSKQPVSAHWMPRGQEAALFLAIGPGIERILALIYTLRPRLGFSFHDLVLDARYNGNTQPLESFLQRDFPQVAKALTALLTGKIKQPPGRPPLGLTAFRDKKSELIHRAISLVREKKKQLRARGESVYGKHEQIRDEILAGLGLDPSMVQNAFENAHRRRPKSRKN